MSLPFFFAPGLDASQLELTLDEDTSKHVSAVLRMKAGELLHLTDGKGNLVTAEIRESSKKATGVTVKSVSYQPPPAPPLSIAISLLKHASRFEWFLEKAVEIGISEIVPLVCARTESEKFRADRLRGIIAGAMLQSQQVWLTELREPQHIRTFLEGYQDDFHPNRLKSIAYCGEVEKVSLTSFMMPDEGAAVMIGPEGDFTEGEISLALGHQFIPVSLGTTRLRTETAGLVSATLLRNMNRLAS